MQYKTTKKIIIDKRKLDILIRLGCPDDRLLSVLKTGNFEKTGDDLIDENLETLADLKDFKNWGGKRLNSGKKKKIFNQDEKQLENQDGVQVVDKDKDKDKDIYNKGNNSIKEEDIKGEPLKEEEGFENFWKLYTPIKNQNGHFVAKGNKQNCRDKYKRLLKEGVKHETIISGLEQYLKYCQRNGVCSCGAEVFINQRRFENDYSDSECIDSQPTTSGQRKPVSIVEIAAKLTRESQVDDSDSIPF